MYDLIIIGGGAAGYSAAIYAGRFMMNTMIFAKMRGGLLTETHIVENYPGFSSISGYELMKKMEEHVKSAGVPIKDEEVIGLSKVGNIFKVMTNEGEYEARSVIIATGTERRKLGVVGEEEFKNKGVSYCATCDGPLYKGKVIAVVGGSDAAAKEALLLSEYAKKVYIIYRNEQIRAEPINKKRAENNKKIEIITNTNILEIRGRKMVESVMLNKPYKEKKELKLDAVFIEIGGVPGSALARHIGVKLNEKGEIVVDRESKTSVAGVFAAGDVCDSRFKQAIISASDGVLAAYSAYEYVNGKK